MTQMTAYICSKNIGGVNIEAPEKDGIVESADQVIAYIQPVSPQPGCKNGVGLITVYIIEAGADEYCLQESSLSWQRETTGDYGNEYPIIKTLAPETCHWIMSLVKMFGTPDIDPDTGKILYYTYPSTGNGECSDDKSDVFPGGSYYDYTLDQNKLIPGMEIRLDNVFWDGSDTVTKSVISKYWCTGAIYGGLVTAVNGDYGNTSLTYTVNVSGQDKVCKASDFAEYSVGDWVFVGKEACSPNVTNPDCEAPDDAVILPLKVNGYGTISRDHEYLEYGLNEVPELFDACVLNGQIITISETEDKASVEISGVGRQDNVPIFYHCPFSTTTENGKKAFKEDDNVSVLVTKMESFGAEYCVCGFPGGPRLCKCMIEEDFLGENPDLVYTWTFAGTLPSLYSAVKSALSGTFDPAASYSVDTVKDDHYWDLSYYANGTVIRFTGHEGETRCVDGVLTDLVQDITLYRLTSTHESYCYCRFYTNQIYYSNVLPYAGDKWLIVDMDLIEFFGNGPGDYPLEYDPLLKVRLLFYTSPTSSATIVDTGISFPSGSGGDGRKKYAVNIGSMIRAKYYSYPLIVIQVYGYYPDLDPDGLTACDGRSIDHTSNPGPTLYGFNARIYSVSVCLSVPSDSIIF